MYRYQRLIVVLSRESEFEDLIRYADLVARLAVSKAIVFLLVAPPAHVPKEIQKKYPNLPNPETELQALDLRRRLERFKADFSGIDVSFEVLRGNPVTEVLGWARKDQADLILVSRKFDDRNSTFLAEKITRKAPCSVLVLPDQFEPGIRKVLVPVDFSEHSIDALEVGIAFAASAGLKKIYVLNVYSVPIPAPTYGEEYEKLVEDFKQWARKSFQDFIGRADLKGLEVVPIFVHDPDTPGAVVQVVQDQKMDLVVVGTRGTSLAVLMGSVTEQLIWNLPVPLVAVKKKGATLGLLDWLFKFKGE